MKMISCVFMVRGYPFDRASADAKMLGKGPVFRSTPVLCMCGREYLYLWCALCSAR